MDHSPVSTKPHKFLLPGPFSNFHKTMQVPTTWTILLFSQKPYKCLLHGLFLFPRKPCKWTIFPFPQKTCKCLPHRTFSCFHRNHACAYHTEHPVSTETMHVPITQNILLFPLASSASPFPVSRIAHTHTETTHVSTTQNIFLLVLAQVNSHHLCQFCCFHDSAHAHTQKTSIIHSSFSSPLLF